MSSLELIRQHRSYFDLHFPGLFTALEDVSNGNLTREAFDRLFLISLQNTASFAAGLDTLSPTLQKQLLDFIGGSPPPGGGSVKYDQSTSGPKFDVHDSNLLDGTGEAIKVVTTAFTNWSGTISNSPQETLIPTTVAGVQSIVQHAASTNQRVRVAGFRQTWSNLFSSDGQILVSLIPLATATGTSADVEASVYGPPTDFNQIELQPAGDDPHVRLVRVGAGVSNEAFRIWAIENGWTLPANVIVVENTIAGVNAPICHGAGITHGPPNDSVRGIEYVDANGVLQRVTDATHLTAAASAFGLLGIVTHLTLEVNKMTYAQQQSAKLPVMLAVPPPTGWIVPDALNGDYTPAQLNDALANFIANAEDSYYCEWFWFALQPQVWVNCWKNTTDASGVVNVPDEEATFLMWIENLSDAWLNQEAAFRSLPGRVQGSVNGMINFNRSPPRPGEDSVCKTHLPNAIHYRRGTQNFPILDTEFEIPIPALSSDPTQPDWSYAQRAWWDALTIAQNDPTGAIRVGIEMRIIGPSTAILAPQQGSEFGFASIELVTSVSAGVDNTWIPLVQQIVDKWTSYSVGGAQLVTRPHWAKMWEEYTVGGVDMLQHLKSVAYKDAIPKFMHTMESIGSEQDWTLDDLKQRFSNPLLDSVFFA